MIEDLRAAGWIDGPWRVTRRRSGRSSSCRSPSRAGTPSTGCSTGAPGRWQRGARRRVRPTSVRRCAGSSRRADDAAIVVRVGDPWPFMEAAGTRAASRTARLARLAPQLAVPSLPFDPTDPRTWRGIQHSVRAAGGEPGLPARSRRRVRRRSGGARRDAAARADQRRLRRVQRLGSGRRPTISRFAGCRRRAATAHGTAATGPARSRRRVRFLIRHRRDVVLIGALPLMAERRRPARSAGLSPAAERTRRRRRRRRSAPAAPSSSSAIPGSRPRRPPTCRSCSSRPMACSPD